MKPVIRIGLPLFSLLLSLLLNTAGAADDKAATVTPERQKVVDAMKRATTFMVDKVATRAATSGRTCRTCRAAGARWKRARR